MRRIPSCLLLALAFLLVLAPASALAGGLQIAGDERERVQRTPRETPPRRGVYVGASIRPGAAGMVDTFIPVVRGAYELGGGITDRFTLGVAVGVTGYLGLDKASFDADVVAHRFFGRGFSLRAALGVTSRAPAMAPVPMVPGVGGSLGLGYEFRVLERLGLGLGADYDLRIRTDARLAQTVLLGVRFTAYLNKRKRSG